MRNFLTKKRVIWCTIIIVIGGSIIASAIKKSRAGNANIQTDTVKRQTIESTVLSTGQVVSSLDLVLSFQTGGTVKQVLVKEGDKVKAGQTLATLDDGTAFASLKTAQGALAQAQASYAKVLAGASNEDIAVASAGVSAAETVLANAQKNLETVKQQQAVLVQNAYSAMLNSTLTLTPGPANSSGDSPVVSGTYTDTQTGQYRVTLFSGGAIQYAMSGLGIGGGNIPTNPDALVPIGHGLYLEFPTATYHADDYWTIDIPNTKASTYLANYNAYQAALQTKQQAINTAEATVRTAQSDLVQTKATLALKQAAARPADMDAARAQILSAEGQVASAAATLRHMTLTAAADGTITLVDIRVGEQATPLKTVMILQNVSDLHAEANVSEANVAALAVGQTVDYTYDALGPDRHFSGAIQTVNPASTVVSGVVNYKVTATLTPAPEIKPGMTVNMTILTAKKEQVLAVPSSAIINQNGKHSVRVIDNPIKKTYHTVDVTTGLEADGGLVEIVNGLTEGETVVTYIKP